jgi:hypothetical protein
MAKGFGQAFSQLDALTFQLGQPVEDLVKKLYRLLFIHYPIKGGGGPL